MDAAELMTKLRYEDDLEGPLADAVIVAGAAGASDESSAGGAAPGFVIVTKKPIAEHAGRIRERAAAIAEENGEPVPHFQFVRALT